MIMYSKVTKVQVNQQKQLQVTEMKITLFRCYGIHMAQSIIDVEHTWHVAAEIKCQKYTWFGAAEIKILCKEGTVYPSR